MKQKDKILAKIRETVQDVEPDAEGFLFGSQARGDARPDSDWDILILTPYPAGLKEEQKFRHKLFELELEYGLAISTFVYYKKEWESKHQVTPLYKNVKREGVRI